MRRAINPNPARSNAKGTLATKLSFLRLATLVLIASAAWPESSSAQQEEPSNPIPVAEIKNLIAKDYLRPTEVTGESVDEIIRGLDPGSSYIPAATVLGWQRRSPVAGIGIVLVPTGREPIVEAVLAQGSARAAGIRAGDLLVAVDGLPTAGRRIDVVAEQLRGGEQTSVKLTMRRLDGLRDFAVVRTVAPRGQEVTARRLGAVVYIRIDTFESGTADRVSAAVKSLKDQTPRMRGLVLDLRDCPGGLFDQALHVADLFLDSGPLVFQRGRDPKDVERYVARTGDLLPGLKIAVLINSRTAGGAEIVSGTLQERGRATIVGMPSFGDGLVQTVIPLDAWRGGALRLTTSAWYLPSGRPLQKFGVIPDLLVAHGPEDLRPQPREVDVPGALDAPPLNRDSPGQAKAAAPEFPPVGYDTDGKDFQLDRALEVIGP